jgi:hypothetical protein
VRVVHRTWGTTRTATWRATTVPETPIYDHCVVLYGDPAVVHDEIRCEVDPFYRYMKYLEEVYNKLAGLALGIAFG